MIISWIGSIAVISQTVINRFKFNSNSWTGSKAIGEKSIISSIGSIAVIKPKTDNWL